jgi:hypothetical protein
LAPLRRQKGGSYLWKRGRGGETGDVVRLRAYNRQVPGRRQKAGGRKSKKEMAMKTQCRCKSSQAASGLSADGVGCLTDREPVRSLTNVAVDVGCLSKAERSRGAKGTVRECRKSRRREGARGSREETNVLDLSLYGRTEASIYTEKSH